MASVGNSFPFDFGHRVWNSNVNVSNFNWRLHKMQSLYDVQGGKKLLDIFCRERKMRKFNKNDFSLHFLAQFEFVMISIN
jgi:hypothetical protein